MIKVSSRDLSPDILANVYTRYHMADDAMKLTGALWYAQAFVDAFQLAKQYGYPIDRVCGVIAALSPSLKWSLNVEHAERVIAAYPEPAIAGVYGRRNRDKAHAILAGADIPATLNGPKVTAFYKALVSGGYDHTAIVVDRHMCRVLSNADLGETDSVVRPYQYEWYAAHVRTVADHVRIPSPHLQATLWLHWLQHGVIDIPDHVKAVAA